MKTFGTYRVKCLKCVLQFILIYTTTFFTKRLHTNVYLYISFY